MSDTKALHAYVSRETNEAYRLASDEHGVSITGLLEVIGCDLPAILDARPELVRQARRIDAQRRRRDNLPPRRRPAGLRATTG